MRALCATNKLRFFLVSWTYRYGFDWLCVVRFSERPISTIRKVVHCPYEKSCIWGKASIRHENVISTSLVCLWFSKFCVCLSTFLNSCCQNSLCVQGLRMWGNWLWSWWRVDYVGKWQLRQLNEAMRSRFRMVRWGAGVLQVTPGD